MFIELPNQDDISPSKRKISVNCLCGRVDVIRKNNYYKSLIDNNYLCRKCKHNIAVESGSYNRDYSELPISFLPNQDDIRQCERKIVYQCEECNIDCNCVLKFYITKYNNNSTFLCKSCSSKQSQKSRICKFGDIELPNQNDIEPSRRKVNARCGCGYSAVITKGSYRKAMCSNEYKCLSCRMKEIALDPKWLESNAKNRSLMPRISSLQYKLYEYLDDLGIDYQKEGPSTAIGYYVFDCFVPRGNGGILIECQGDYWHDQNIENGADKRKFTYIDRYFPEYEIMYLWEHEFSTKDRIINRLKSKFDIETNIVDFSFNDIIIKRISYADCSSFLDAYHYVGKGRGGIAVGAYLNDRLVACIVYSSKLRQNQMFGQDFRELSRLCIHPSYQKKNFASWFIARTYEFLDTKMIISFCDTTAGHTGTVYKASNFKLSHETKPDYWYVDADGFVMHKKTLYNKAVNLKMTESEYAVKYKFSKRYGGKKLCFIREI